MQLNVFREQAVSDVEFREPFSQTLSQAFRDLTSPENPASMPILKDALHQVAELLGVPWRFSDKALSFESPEFLKFCDEIAATVFKPETSDIVADTALSILHAVTSLQIEDVPDGFGHKVVLPRTLAGGVAAGLLVPPPRVYSYEEPPALASFERLSSRDPDSLMPSLTLHIRRSPGLSIDGDESRYSLALVIRIEGGAVGAFTDSRLPDKAFAFDPRDRDPLKLANGRILISSKHMGNERFEVLIRIRREESLNRLEELLPRVTHAAEMLLPRVDLREVIEGVLPIARESDKLGWSSRPCELYEYHPQDEECERFLFNTPDEARREYQPGHGGLPYPRETPLRDCAKNIFASGGDCSSFMLSEIIKASGLEHPKVLFIPTASLDERQRQYEMERDFRLLGCYCRSLELIDSPPSYQETAEMIHSSDIIYVGGGNTHLMMRCWSRLGVDRLLEEAAASGKLMAGHSAGAICWCQSGNSDSLSYYRFTPDFVRVRGLDFIDVMLVPHWSNPGRRHFVEKQMQESGNVAICLDDCSAIHVVEGTYRIVTSIPPHTSTRGYGWGLESAAICGYGNAHFGAYRLFWRDGAIVEERIPTEEGYRPFRELVDKTHVFPKPHNDFCDLTDQGRFGW